MSSNMSVSSPRPTVVTSTKSVGIQILLVVFLGPLGLFYSTIKGALIMLFGVPVAAGVVMSVLAAMGTSHNGTAGAALLGIAGVFLLTAAVWWIGSFIWGVVAVNDFNRRLMQ